MARKKTTPQQRARREIFTVSCWDIYQHQYWMDRALDEAYLAGEAGEVPVGAVIVRNEENKDTLIAVGHNERQHLQDPTCHAEMQAIRSAAKRLGSWCLNDCTLYVTLEPCCMCAGAILQARIPRVVFGARDPKAGAVESLFSLLNDRRLNHRCNVIGGILDTACAKPLTGFFKGKRSSRAEQEPF